jgi:hypothetical protein
MGLLQRSSRLTFFQRFSFCRCSFLFRLLVGRFFCPLLGLDLGLSRSLGLCYGFIPGPQRLVASILGCHTFHSYHGQAVGESGAHAQDQKEAESGQEEAYERLPPTISFLQGLDLLPQIISFMFVH